MSQQHAALLQLLQDDDPGTLLLVKDQLTGRGAAALPELRALMGSASGAAARHLREVVMDIEKREADHAFELLCRNFDDAEDLENAAWQLAATFLPGEDFQPHRELLDAWGAEVAKRIAKVGAERDRIETLVEYLAHELRFRGNEDDYYSLSNSLLPEVIETRLGNPITLSLVYLLVGRRAGLTVDGVGLPGHFVIRYRADFFDPFHGGRRLGLEECRALLAQRGETLTAEHLEPTAPRPMLARMLTNIYCLAAPSDPPLAARIAGWIEALGNARATE